MGQCCSSGGGGGESSTAGGADKAETPAAQSGEPAQQTEETPAATENEQPKENEPSGEAKPVVFVLGASGSIGTATLKSLSSKFADKVEIRAGVRNPETADKLKEISSVTVVQASMADKDGLVTTLAGVSALYIVVPGAENRAELAALSVEAAKEAEVKHIVVVSVPSADLEDTIFGKQFKEIEAKVSGIGIPFTLLRLAYFMDNYLGFASTVKENGQFYAPVSGDKPFTAVATSDAGFAAASILVDPSKHEGKTYNVVSCRNTMDDIASTLSTLLEKEITFVKAEASDTKQTFLGFGMAEWQVDGLLELFKLMDEGSPETNQEDLGDFKTITGEDPTSLKDFFTNFEAAFK